MRQNFFRKKSLTIIKNYVIADQIYSRLIAEIEQLKNSIIRELNSDVTDDGKSTPADKRISGKSALNYVANNWNTTLEHLNQKYPNWQHGGTINDPSGPERLIKVALNRRDALVEQIKATSTKHNTCCKIL